MIEMACVDVLVFVSLTTKVGINFVRLVIRMNVLIWGDNVFTDPRNMWWQFLLVDNKNNNDTWHSKIFDLFNNKSKIIFLLQFTVRFSVSYSDPEDISSWFFDDKMVHNIYG